MEDYVKTVTEAIGRDPELARALAMIIQRAPSFGEVTLTYRFGRIDMLSTRWDTKFSWSGGGDRQ